MLFGDPTQIIFSFYKVCAVSPIPEYILPSPQLYPPSRKYVLCSPSQNTLYCSAWLRLKLNTRIGLHTTHHLPPPPPHKLSAVICQLSLIRFRPNFRCRFLETSKTDSNYHSDICPDKIFPGDIYPYHECLWDDLNQTSKVGSWDNLFWQFISNLKFFRPKILLIEDDTS